MPHGHRAHVWEGGLLLPWNQAEGYADMAPGRENELETDTQLQMCTTAQDPAQGSPHARPLDRGQGWPREAVEQQSPRGPGLQL